MPSTSRMFSLPDPTQPLTMMSSTCRSLSFALFSLVASVLLVSGIIFTTVRAQQSGSVSFGSGDANKTDKINVPTLSTTNSNNYAASIAALTVGKPSQYIHTAHQQNHKNSNPEKYTGKSTFKIHCIFIFDK